MVKSTFYLLLASTFTSILNASQIVPLTRHGNGYSLKLKCNEENHVEASFLLNLHNSNSILGGPNKCLGFSNYKDKGIILNAAENSEQEEIRTPLAVFNGKEGMIKCGLDSTWVQHTNFSVIVPDSCSNGLYSTEENNEKIGWLGMTPNMKNNTFVNQIDSFGIKIPNATNSDQEGKLLLNVDFRTNWHADRYLIGVPAVIPANMDFHLEFVNEIYYGTRKEFFDVQKDNIKIIFDLNYAYIGLPEIVYNAALALFELKGLVCPEEIEDPVCVYDGEVKDLPFIGIGFAYGTEHLISIGYDQYIDMQAYNTKKEIKLRLKKLKNVSENLAQYIILGRAYMESYYLTFDFKNLRDIKVRIFGDDEVNHKYPTEDDYKMPLANKNFMFIKKKKDEIYGHRSTFGYYIMGAIVGFGLLAALVIACRTKKEEKESLITNAYQEFPQYHELVRTQV